MSGNNLLRPLMRCWADNVDCALFDHHEVDRLVPRLEYGVTHRHILRSAVDRNLTSCSVVSVGKASPTAVGNSGVGLVTSTSGLTGVHLRLLG